MSKLTKKLYLWNRKLHREIGYLCVGLTVVFAVSGFALNHIHDWNSNYKRSFRSLNLPPLPQDFNLDKVTAKHLLKTLKIDGTVKTIHAQSPQVTKLFLENKVITIDLANKEALVEKTSQRFLLKDFNDLHLNTPRYIWTYISDIYAVCLLFLALSGLFMVKGKHSPLKKGAISTSIGLLIIPIFLIIYKYL
ncbi:MAG: PepSY-associated TM helix domain-containing protein [Bacteriovoracaceae bacterium]|nr:PepSY-associated TM helix domain-containing protein [Bacteriovoracaceae bacterium]